MTPIDLEKFIKKNVINRNKSLFHKDLRNNYDELLDNIKGKSVLVIGGAGTIGSSFIKAILKYFPKELVIVDYNENGLTELTRDLRSSTDIKVPEKYITYPFDFSSSIFYKLLRKNKFDIVACFAAHKHVRSEKDHLAVEAMIKNNVFNTKSLLDNLKENKPSHFFCVSTDKAANPVNVMGASKKLMEKVLMSYTDSFKITTARFANVAFSNGSLLDGFTKRIAKKQPLSAPKDVKRYFVSPEESGQLCLLACILGKTGEIFFPKLKKEQMLTFSTIAEKYLIALNLSPNFFLSEEEARISAAKWNNKKSNYPVYFFKSDTSGEKTFEEFFTEHDELGANHFEALGIIRKIQNNLSNDNIESTLQRLNLAFDTEETDKADIVAILSECLSDFHHIETGKNLDQKM